MKKLFLTLVLLFAVSPAFAETWQTLYTGPIAINTGATRYFVSNGRDTSATEANRQMVASSSGTFTKMRVKLSTAPNNGVGSQTVTIALRLAGATSALSCTITEDEATCNSGAVVTVTAGQTVAFIQTVANTPAASNVEVTLYYYDNTANRSWLGFGNFTAGSALTYYSLSWEDISATENIISTPMPTSGTLRNLYVSLSGSPNLGAGTQTYTMTVWKNGSAPASGLTCAISETATTCNDTSNSVTIAAGDTISLEFAPSGTPTARFAKFGMNFDATNEGEFVIPGGRSANMSATVTQYKGLTSVTAWNSTENVVDQITQEMSIRAIYLKTTAAPDNGAGTQSYAFTIRDDVVATNHTCTISESNTTCNFSNSGDDVVLDSQMSIEVIPANTPTATNANFSVLAFNMPSRRLFGSTIYGATLY